MNEIGLFDINFATGKCYWSFELKRMLGVRHDVPAEFHLLLQCIHPDDRRAFGRNAMQPFREDCRGTHRSSSGSCTTMAACGGCTWNGERSRVRMVRKKSCASSASHWKLARPQVCRALHDRDAFAAASSRSANLSQRAGRAEYHLKGRVESTAQRDPRRAGIAFS